MCIIKVAINLIFNMFSQESITRSVDQLSPAGLISVRAMLPI